MAIKMAIKPLAKLHRNNYCFHFLKGSLGTQVLVCVNTGKWDKIKSKGQPLYFNYKYNKYSKSCSNIESI